jgi:hypothetical protein
MNIICPNLLFKEFLTWFLMEPPNDNFPKNGAHLILKNDV